MLCLFVYFLHHVRHSSHKPLAKYTDFFTKCNQKEEKKKILTTKEKPSILATLWPLVTFTVFPDGVKFPLNTGEHCISVHLNTTPPNNTQSRHYTLPQTPSIYPNSMIIYGPAVMHKEAIFIWDSVGGVFIFFPQFVMGLFVAKRAFEWDMAPVDLGEWKV